MDPTTAVIPDTLPRPDYVILQRQFSPPPHLCWFTPAPLQLDTADWPPSSKLWSKQHRHTLTHTHTGLRPTGGKRRFSSWAVMNRTFPLSCLRGQKQSGYSFESSGEGKSRRSEIIGGETRGQLSVSRLLATQGQETVTGGNASLLAA